MDPISLVTELEDIIESLDLSHLTRAEIASVIEQLKDYCVSVEACSGTEE